MNSKVEKVFLIPAYDRFEYFKKCINSIILYNINYKILVCDHTGDGLVSNEKLAIDYILRPKYNLGFARAMNKLAKTAIDLYNPQYLVFCNEDVEFIDKRWWDGVMQCFNENNLLVGVNPSSPIDKTGETPIHNGKPLVWTVYDDLLSQYCDLEGTCMWCTVVPTEKWLEIGFFDDRFYPAGGEDYDWHYRAYKKGYRIISTNKSWAIHYWSRYNKKIGDVRNSVLPTRDDLRWNDFHSKWGPNANIYGESGHDVAYNQ